MIRSNVVLPHPDGPKKAHQLARLDRQIDRFERDKTPEGLVDCLPAEPPIR